MIESLRKLRNSALKTGMLNVLLAMLHVFVPASESEARCFVIPDVETASDKYKRRFASNTGKWFLDGQSSGLMSMLNRWESASILDAGGGHGQYTRQLIDRGHSVTVMGGAIEARTQISELIAGGACRYVVGDFSRFPFADKSFDIVLAFRLMTHLECWERFVGEASRVARSAVIVDFPTRRSANITYPILFSLKHLMEDHTTRPFQVFDEKKVLESFRSAGLYPTARHAQYFFPMVLHRVLHNVPVSAALENVCRSVALTDYFGSPVILRVEPNLKERKKTLTAGGSKSHLSSLPEQQRKAARAC